MCIRDSKKDVSVEPPSYLVFFKGRDVDVMTAAFKEFSAKTVKQKTAYEIIAGDWSSDVCSSDLTKIASVSCGPHNTLAIRFTYCLYRSIPFFSSINFPSKIS